MAVLPEGNVDLDGNDSLVGVMKSVVQAGTQTRLGKNPGNVSRGAETAFVEQTACNNDVNRSVIARVTENSCHT